MTIQSVFITEQERKWNAQRMKLKSSFPSLSSDDLRYETGKCEETLNRIRTKIGRAESDLDAILTRLR